MAAVAVAGVVAVGCTSEPPLPPDASGAGTGSAPSLAEARRCDGPSEPLPASPALEVFDPDGKVDRVLRDGLDLQRGQVELKAALVRSKADPGTTLPHVGALQRGLVDGPRWAHSAVADVVAPMGQECARDQGEVLAGIVQALDARNSPSAQGLAPRPQPVGDLQAELDPDEPLLGAFREVYAVTTPWPRRPLASSLADSEPSIRDLALALGPASQRALASVVLGMARSETWRLDAARPMFTAGRIDYEDLAAIFKARTLSRTRARRFDYQAMGRAGTALALAVERLSVQLAAEPLPPDLGLRLTTPLGEVVLSGQAGDDVYDLAAPALVVDQGGNDTYRGVVAGPAVESVPLSVAIDLGGNDSYLGGEVVGTQGAGIGSFGFLVDRAGDDRYEATSLAQGAGFLGLGLIDDTSGNDRYDAVTQAQGAGQHGIGVAVDRAGNDAWRLTNQGQGYGFVRSLGLLLDAGGDDSYEAQDEVVTKPSPQSARHNTSMAQGAGYGLRTDDRGSSMSGGTGMLVDLAGRDRYSCGVFCQGTGYFFAHGILYDGSGDDSYRGVWYTQGAAAHFALATLIDESGSDSYVATIAGSHGQGHDESAGFFLEGGGDDTYEVPLRSNGVGNNVGVGFFVEAGGADTYNAAITERGPGRFGEVVTDGDWKNYRGYQGARSVALFLDLAGDDRYVGAPPEIGNARTWKLPGAVSSAAVAPPPPEHVSYGEDLAAP